MDFKGLIICDHVVGNPTQKFTLSKCPRCLGKGVYGGIISNNNGDISTIEGADYLSQSIKKILISKINNRGYGFNYNLLSNVIEPTSLVVIKREVLRCLVFLQNAQQDDKKRGVGYLPSEEIARIGDVDVKIKAQDPRGVEVRISIFTTNGNLANVSQVLTR
ncbi:MAG: hypothetical protein WC346_06455 [Methanogenium sp.]|jgi:hypothetical protein